ncbi:helix-turn-helix domain-containing protein [Dolichospermum sp. UHCC 0684]|jgi:transcriptional regulator with XRE-family HTH domain|uniref:Helix-turn-helix domain-containing protein n=2 Tax=Aphanizomenonaceae TaxID=1892259 RepID=A0A6H2BW49_DOLFA|nr:MULTISPECIES: helix-turn-helix domain-containing protein [Nostocales]QSV55595.1 MAG: helix-turn-helix domain-containing protein [Dolichospermum sp. UKL201]AFW93797.1 restriction endonuclease PvuII [Anabaena sp. 90]MEA5528096.1 helix-turn-helix domain-containing protein [Dolichospermum sp. UHCC 0684]MTJ18466.1 helix-turn-helix domain-containing protein [Dolichospermum sp. UHCC 0299]MTJ34257.1 helix-turn-helix domain-containing protein [Dolichospermum sp. UHCC 0260]
MSFERYKEVKQLFGDRVQALRKDRGITQEQLAEDIDKSVEHISYIERGERAPSFETILDIAEALKVSVPYLMNVTPQTDISTNFLTELQTPVVLPSLVEPVKEAVNTTKERRSDLERLQTALGAIQELQSLANEYGINDVFQDNGGKVLQVLILLGLRISPGREGNDAIDAEKNEYELKTINKLLSKSVTTNHHLNLDILAKYRAVKAWYIAVYEGILLKAIYRVDPTSLETKFSYWESRIRGGMESINNPKIPLSLIEKEGELVYPKQNQQTIPGNLPI